MIWPSDISMTQTLLTVIFLFTLSVSHTPGAVLEALSNCVSVLIINILTILEGGTESEIIHLTEVNDPLCESSNKVSFIAVYSLNKVSCKHKASFIARSIRLQC